MKNLNSKQLKVLSQVCGVFAIISLMAIIKFTNSSKNGVPYNYGLPIMLIIIGEVFSRKAKTKKKEEESSKEK